ncbi:phosphorylase [Cupriavidus sp. 2TAF22]|uniref:phosphorylase n=1 Tax=unclassified Cupriavidus TaxID=2640874 RepID=UPI003F9063CC
MLVVTGMRFEARIAAGPGIETLHGLRAEALAQGLRERLAQPCAGVISFGVAGGLDPALLPGKVILATGIRAGASFWPADAAWLRALSRSLPDAVAGTLAGDDSPVTSVAAKSALHAATGALAADMESHIAARIAHEYGVPFAACRVVVDPAARDVPPAAVAGMGADGGTDIWAVLKSLLAGPGQLPDLLRLARDAKRARLGLEAARRRVGTGFGLA